MPGRGGGATSGHLPREPRQKSTNGRFNSSSGTGKRASARWRLISTSSCNYLAAAEGPRCPVDRTRRQFAWSPWRFACTRACGCPWTHGGGNPAAPRRCRVLSLLAIAAKHRPAAPGYTTRTRRWHSRWSGSTPGGYQSCAITGMVEATQLTTKLAINAEVRAKFRKQASVTSTAFSKRPLQPFIAAREPSR